MDEQRFHLTQEGLEEIKKELAELRDERRPGVVERLVSAREVGDLSENNEYKTAREELTFIDGRIEELEQLVEKAKVIPGGRKKGEVDLGARVTVQVNGTISAFHVVGEWEADPKNQRISHESPIGKALMGKKVGDEVEVEAPVGKVNYKIVGIE